MPHFDCANDAFNQIGLARLEFGHGWPQRHKQLTHYCPISSQSDDVYSHYTIEEIPVGLIDPLR